MARWRQMQQPDGSYRMVPLDEAAAKIDGVKWNPEEQHYSHFIHNDMEQFVSPIDGSMIRDRKQYREHCKKHGVVPASEFDDAHYEQHAKRRQDMAEGNISRQERQKRREAMHELWNHAERGGRLNTDWRHQTLDD